MNECVIFVVVGQSADLQRTTLFGAYDDLKSAENKRDLLIERLGEIAEFKIELTYLNPITTIFENNIEPPSQRILTI